MDTRRAVAAVSLDFCCCCKSVQLPNKRQLPLGRRVSGDIGGIPSMSGNRRQLERDYGPYHAYSQGTVQRHQHPTCMRKYKNSTALSKHVWSLKEKYTDFNFRYDYPQQRCGPQMIHHTFVLGGDKVGEMIFIVDLLQTEIRN